MKYTRSLDGVMRAHCWGKARLDKETVQTVRRLAKQEGVSLQVWLGRCLADGICSAIKAEFENQSQGE